MWANTKWNKWICKMKYKFTNCTNWYVDKGRHIRWNEDIPLFMYERCQRVCGESFTTGTDEKLCVLCNLLIVPKVGHTVPCCHKRLTVLDNGQRETWDVTTRHNMLGESRDFGLSGSIPILFDWGRKHQGARKANENQDKRVRHVLSLNRICVIPV